MAEHYLERELYQLVRSDAGVFDFLQSGSLDGIWYWDLENPEHEWMSDKFWEVLGHQPSDKRHLAAEWQDMIHPDDLEHALENFEKHCADPSHPYDQVVRYTHEDGSTVWVRCRGIAIRDTSGNPRRMLGAHTNITALKQTEEDLRAALLSNEELQQFAYVASHDLREPLRVAQCYVDLMARRLEPHLDENTRGFVTKAKRSLRHAQTQVRGLLDFASLGARRGAREATATGDLVERARQNLEVLIRESRAEIVVGPLPTVPVDAEQLTRVFENLISNAIKFRGDESPRVRVSASLENERWTFEIEDNGMGIEENDQARVFQMFQRLHARDERGGSGIGLAVSKRIVEMHGGVMQVTSQLGVGSRFTFSLPTGETKGTTPPVATRRAS